MDLLLSRAGCFQGVAAFKLANSKNIVNSPYTPKSHEVFCFNAKVLSAYFKINMSGPFFLQYFA